MMDSNKNSGGFLIVTLLIVFFGAIAGVDKNIGILMIFVMACLIYVSDALKEIEASKIAKLESKEDGLFIFSTIGEYLKTLRHFREQLINIDRLGDDPEDQEGLLRTVASILNISLPKDKKDFHIDLPTILGRNLDLILGDNNE